MDTLGIGALLSRSVRRNRGARMLALLAILAMVAAATASAAPPASPPLPNMMLVVDAKPEVLAAYDRALRKLVPRDYRRYGLGCSVDYLDGDGDEGCAVMREGNPVPDDLEKLVYYFNDGNKDLVRKFETARVRAQQKAPKENLLLDFRRYEERTPDCRVFRQPCAYLPYCSQFGSCSAQGSSCVKC
jgi:hypothetical protein